MTRVLIPRSDNRNAKKIETSDFTKLFSFINNHVVSGFCMSAGTGLSADLSAGTAKLSGIYVEGTTTDTVSCLLPCDGNYVYITMCNDPNGEPQAWKFTSNITGVTPSCSLFLGIATTSCSGVTSVDVTGRPILSGLEGPQYNQFCSTGTFTPSKQTCFTTVTVDTSCLTAGSINVKVDGSTTASYESGTNTSIINPSCSLTICANDKGHDLTAASYDSKNKFFCGYFRGMYFRSDGAKYYLAGYTGLREIDMSTPWDISTASDNGTWTGVRPTIEFGTTVFFKPDGTKAWISGTPPSGTCYSIREVEFTTAWDVTTASYSGTTWQPVCGSVTESVYFKSDGTKGYALTSNDCVNEFSMSTPWDISTASVVNTYCTSAQDGSPKGIDFNDVGTYYYISGDSNNTIFEYSMSTPWDISTSSYTGNSFSVASQTTAPSSVRFGNSGAKMYIMKQDQRVYQYSSVTAFAGTARASVL